MRAQDMIKTMLTIIDGGQAAQVSIEAPWGDPPAETGEVSPLTYNTTSGDEVNRFKQIVDLASEPKQPTLFANSPDEHYADIDAVTVDAGGGMNGPKHPHDLRVKDPSAYPHTQDQSSSLEPHSNRTGLHGALIDAMRGL